MKNVTRSTALIAVPVMAALASLPASAAVDLTSITGAFSAGDIVTGVLAVGAVLATVAVTVKGVFMIVGLINRGKAS